MKKVIAGILCSVLLFSGGCASVDRKPYAELIISSEASAPEESSSESSVPSSSETVSVTPLPPAPAMEEGWWKKALAQNVLMDESNHVQDFYIYLGEDSYSIRSIDSFSANRDDYYDFSLLLSTAAEVEDIGKPLESPDFFEIVMKDGTSYKATFYERGIALVPTLPGKQDGKAALLAIDSKDYEQALTNIQDEVNSERQLLPAWISRLRQNLCSSIAMTSSDGKNQSEYALPDTKRIGDIISRLKSIDIEPDLIKKVDKTAALENATKIELAFSNGSSCKIQYDGAKLIVAPSNEEYALQYIIYSEDKFQLDNMAKGEFIPITAKPVIYLYPEKPTDVTVKVDYKGEFSYTYPAYNGGWQVTAYPDGRLVNKEDGGEYYYLFWEGNANARWRFDEGFVVKGSETEQFLRSTLSSLGLTPREYNDFIVYWLPQMQHNPYNLVTFATDEYEALAPLTVTPAPDSILRVHMVYKPLEKPIELPEQKLTPFVRKGFTVVEWGGSHAR